MRDQRTQCNSTGRNVRLGMFWMSLPPTWAQLLGLPGDLHSPPPGITFGPIQEQVCSPRAVFCLSISAGKGAGDHQILPVPGEARRLGVGAELRHRRAQQPLLPAALHRECQLCPHVSQTYLFLSLLSPSHRPPPRHPILHPIGPMRSISHSLSLTGTVHLSPVLFYWTIWLSGRF